MHQQLIQWIEDEVEVVKVDESACIALADTIVDWQHPVKGFSRQMPSCDLDAWSKAT